MVYFSKIAFHCIIKTCVTVHAEGNIWFPEGSYLCVERQYWFPEGNIWFPEGSYFLSRKTVLVSRRKYLVPRRKLVTNRSIMAAQRSQTSRFNVGFSGRNSEPTVKQPKEVFSRKHRARTLLESYAWLLVQNSKTL